MEEPLATEGMREVEYVMRPVWGPRRLEEGRDVLAGGLGGLGLSPLGAGAELFFPEAGEKAGILEAGRVGEVAL